MDRSDADTRPYRATARRILQLIGDQDLGPGARLPPERNLAAMLQVSRSTVREALIALEFEGEVWIAPGSGVYVRTPADDSAGCGVQYPAGDLFAARLLVAAEVAALAARHASSVDLERLRLALSAIDAAGGGNDALELAFVRTLGLAAGNAALAGLVDCLWTQQLLPIRNLPPAVCGEVVAAIAVRDRAAARRAAISFSTHLTTGSRPLR